MLFAPTSAEQVTRSADYDRSLRQARSEMVTCVTIGHERPITSACWAKACVSGLVYRESTSSILIIRIILDDENDCPVIPDFTGLSRSSGSIWDCHLRYNWA